MVFSVKGFFDNKDDVSDIVLVLDGVKDFVGKF